MIAPYRDPLIVPKKESAWMRLGLIVVMAIPLAIVGLVVSLFRKPDGCFCPYVVSEGAYLFGLMFAAIPTFQRSDDWGSHPSFFDKRPRLALLAFTWWPVSIVVIVGGWVYSMIRSLLLWLRYGDTA